VGEGIRFGIQIAAMRRRTAPLEVTLYDDPLALLLEAGKLVEALGFEGLFLHDHPYFSPDPWVGLAGLATVTERVTLGSVVFCVPYRHPALLARMASDLDNLSRGRLMLGLGIGWAEPEFRALEVPFDSVPKRQAALEEAIAIVEGVWGDEPFSFAGAHYRTENMRVVPRPIQTPRPPLMIAGAGKRTLHQVARLGDICNFGEIQPSADAVQAEHVSGPERIRQRLELLQRHCEEVGRPYDEILRSHFVSWLMLAPTEAEARDKVRRYFEGDESAPMARAVLAGTPAQIVEYYQARADAGMQYFVVQMLDCTDHETLELLAREVMPHVH
jgi:alkanesulfonate monooxygenase SsuD/methylene tetrahydromethanopterin reductase-like flavin-dependent oxidoreductase (luciferase family)